MGKTHAHKARSIKTWISEFAVEELDWPARIPNLNPTEHLWDELETASQDFYFNIGALPHKCDSG